MQTKKGRGSRLHVKLRTYPISIATMPSLNCLVLFNRPMRKQRVTLKVMERSSVHKKGMATMFYIS